MQQADCYVETKKKSSEDEQLEKFNYFHLFTAFYFLTTYRKTIEAP